jgi:hypothetical protein
VSLVWYTFSHFYDYMDGTLKKEGTDFDGTVK